MWTTLTGLHIFIIHTYLRYRIRKMFSFNVNLI
nr:MAG TPA: hypothetical protein [Caudoviricetes sp.]